MKKTKIFYWIVTGLFSAFMLFTAIPDIVVVPEAVEFMTHLGYPVYIIPFIGVAKLLGAVVILLPRLDRLKEWAYAGLAIDLAGATYSVVSVDGFNPGVLFMLLPFTLLILSYILHHKKKEMQLAQAY
jgi:hypothetical protein